MQFAAAHNFPLVCGWSHAVTPSTLLLRGSETVLVCLPLLWPHGDLARVHEGLIFIRLDVLHAFLRPRGWLLHIKCACMFIAPHSARSPQHVSRSARQGNNAVLVLQNAQDGAHRWSALRTPLYCVMQSYQQCRWSLALALGVKLAARGLFVYVS
jgi:hypothetical protein